MVHVLWLVALFNIPSGVIGGGGDGGGVFPYAAFPLNTIGGDVMYSHYKL